MGFYKSESGKEYSFKFNYGLVLHLKEIVGLDLLDPHVTQSALGNKSTLEAVSDRGTSMIMFLFHVMKYSNPSLSEEEIFDSMEGVGAVRLQEAFYTDWENFSRKRGRPDVANTIRKQQELITKAIKMAAEEVERLDEDKILKEQQDKLHEELGKRMTFTDSSGESQDDYL